MTRLCWKYRKDLFFKIKPVVYGFTLKMLNLRVFATAPVVYGPLPKISCAGNALFGKRCIFRSFRLVPHISILQGGKFQIGDNGYINDGTNICASLSVKIGHSVKIGDMVYIYDTDFHVISPDRPVKQKPITIGNNVWIGSNCTILAGANIGDHVVIGAGSIVTGYIPSKCIAVGNPAKVIRMLDIPDEWERK